MMGDSESIMIEEKHEDSNLQPKQEKTKKESTTLPSGTTPWGTTKKEDTSKRKVEQYSATALGIILTRISQEARFLANTGTHCYPDDEHDANGWDNCISYRVKYGTAIYIRGQEHS